MAEPQTCKRCGHYHIDHSYQSFLDAEKEQPFHRYSCRICDCNVEMEGSLDEFRGMIIVELGFQM